MINIKYCLFPMTHKLISNYCGTADKQSDLNVEHSISLFLVSCDCFTNIKLKFVWYKKVPYYKADTMYMMYYTWSCISISLYIYKMSDTFIGNCPVWAGSLIMMFRKCSSLLHVQMVWFLYRPLVSCPICAGSVQT